MTAILEALLPGRKAAAAAVACLPGPGRLRTCLGCAVSLLMLSRLTTPGLTTSTCALAHSCMHVVQGCQEAACMTLHLAGVGREGPAQRILHRQKASSRLADAHAQLHTAWRQVAPQSA